MAANAEKEDLARQLSALKANSRTRLKVNSCVDMRLCALPFTPSYLALKNDCSESPIEGFAASTYSLLPGIAICHHPVDLTFLPRDIALLYGIAV